MFFLQNSNAKLLLSFYIHLMSLIQAPFDASPFHTSSLDNQEMIEREISTLP